MNQLVIVEVQDMAQACETALLILEVLDNIEVHNKQQGVMDLENFHLPQISTKVQQVFLLVVQMDSVLLAILSRNKTI